MLTQLYLKKKKPYFNQIGGHLVKLSGISTEQRTNPMVSTGKLDFSLVSFSFLCFHTSTLETKRFQKSAAVFIGVFERFSLDDMKKYAFSNENALVWMGPKYLN